MAKLIFRYGAMNAGKSTVLMQVAYNFEENDRKVIVMKAEKDTKGDNKVVSRLGIDRKVDILIDEKESVLENKYLSVIRKCHAILVDEAQFLTENQIEELWIISKRLDIPVICYGLKTDFTTHSFEGSRRLFELADELEELVTICRCGKKARYNARKVNGVYTIEGDQTVIDGTDKIQYVPMCANCYIQKVLKKTLL